MKSVNAVTIKELYDLSHTEAKPLMEQYTYPWEVLPKSEAKRVLGRQ